MISVIIPVYNGKKYIKKAIKSVLNQTYKNIELLVIDDGSTDGLTEKYIKSINEKILYYKKRNEGLGPTRNFGLNLSKGDFVFFLDADDDLPIDALSNLRKNIKNFDFIVGRCERVYYDKNNNITKKLIWKKYLYYKKHIKYNLFKDTISTNKLYKKNFLIKNKIFFEKGLYEDKLFVVKIFENSNKYIYIKNIVYHWNVYYKSNSITNSLNISNLQERLLSITKSIEYTNDEKLKKEIVKYAIQHDFKLYINKSLLYNGKEIEYLYNSYRHFINKYKKYININDYFVDRIIIFYINNKKATIKEFNLIAKENNTKNIFIKIKKYIRYTIAYIKMSVYEETNI